MKRISLIILTTLLLNSCGQRPQGGQHTDRFYTQKGEFDFARFPLIKPYEVIHLFHSDDWSVRSADTSGLPESIPGVRSINIIDSTILIYSKNTIMDGQSVDEGWFVLLPKKNELHGFKSQKEYSDYLFSIAVVSPKMFKVTNVFEYFDSRDSLNWKEINKSF